MAHAPTPSHIPLRRASDEPRAALRWLVWLRWASALGQLATIAVATPLVEMELDHPLLLSLVAAGALSNLGLELYLRRPLPPASPDLAARYNARLVFAVLVLDVVLLTALLLASGGPSNPFSVFYLVHVVLAGLVLGAFGAWNMAALTTIAFGLLFVLPSIPIDHHAHHGGSNGAAASLHLQGMWVAYVLAACFLATFVSGLTRALTRRDLELQRLRSRNERSERLAALATLSASAAHELGSPLATIAVAARELELDLTRDKRPTELLPDARLIREEVERCRGLLHEMSRRGGLLTGENPEPTDPDALWREVATRAGRRPGLRLDLAPQPPSIPSLTIPRAAITQALVNLVENAHDAHLRAGRDAPIRVGTTVTTGPTPAHPKVRLWVEDQGQGFGPEILAELGEAFVTSRPGEGRGRGLHLADRLAKDLGGRLEVHSTPEGSVVSLELPLPKAPSA
jgi:two-component system sensor histidine kinase RegB